MLALWIRGLAMWDLRLCMRRLCSTRRHSYRLRLR